MNATVAAAPPPEGDRGGAGARHERQALRAGHGRGRGRRRQGRRQRGAGTIEFIADGAGGLKEGGFWFMEMNTRLQVEHPVTEAITGLDLVEWQFRIAAARRLPLTQGEVPLGGHAVEARLYAEDPERGFLPSTGKLLALQFPQGDGLRVDTGVEAGSEVTPFYDPMIAKLIAHGNTRNEALDRLAGALDHTVVIGRATMPASWPRFAAPMGFRNGDFDTGFIDRHGAELGAAPQRSTAPPPRLVLCTYLMATMPRKPHRKAPRSLIPPGRHATAFNSAVRAGSWFRSWSTARVRRPP